MLGPALNYDLTKRSSYLLSGWWSSTSTGDGIVVPDGATDLIWSPGQIPWIAGPDTAPRQVQAPAGIHFVGVRLRPSVAPAILGMGANHVADLCVPLLDTLSQALVDQVDEALEQSETLEQQVACLAALVVESVPLSWRPDDAVVAGLEMLDRGDPLVIDGYSERQFRRRFTQAVGYGPAFYRRIARLSRFSQLAKTTSQCSNAELAASVGYFDEAHLWRDSLALTGQSASEFRSQH